MNMWGVLTVVVGFLMLYIGVKGTGTSVVNAFRPSTATPNSKAFSGGINTPAPAQAFGGSITTPAPPPIQAFGNGLNGGVQAFGNGFGG